MSMKRHFYNFRLCPEPVHRAAFTLLEMLVVIGVIGILLTLTVPAVSGMMKSSRLTASGDQVLSLFSAAQQIASVEGRPVEIRFVKHKMAGGLYDAHYQTALILRSYQMGEVLPDGKPAAVHTSVLAADPVMLPQGIVISSNTSVKASSLMDATPTLEYAATDSTKSKMKIFKGGALVDPILAYTPDKYCSVIIRAEGTSLPLKDAAGTAQKWYVTLLDERDEEKATSFGDVHNFYCIQIDPINGHASSYRP